VTKKDDNQFVLYRKVTLMTKILKVIIIFYHIFHIGIPKDEVDVTATEKHSQIIEEEIKEVISDSDKQPISIPPLSVSLKPYDSEV
jgi:hypothetical protein